jgi:hypothetical protein
MKSLHLQLDRKAQRLTVVGKHNKLRVIDLNPFGGAAIFASIPPGIAKAPLLWHGKGERYANVSSRVGGGRSGLSCVSTIWVTCARSSGGGPAGSI